MKTREEWENELLAKGCIDERRAFTMSNIQSAPRGEYGMALLCINGEELRVYDTDFSSLPKGLLYTIQLPQITEVKLSTFVFHPSLKFKYNGIHYAFAAGFAKKSAFVEVLSQFA